jgi:serine/threonine protein phosphatase PrpC
MEDAHTHILEMENDKSASFFAVYDGHGGKVLSGLEKLFKPVNLSSMDKNGVKEE